MTRVMYAPCQDCGKNGKPQIGIPGRADLINRKMFVCECGAYCDANSMGRPVGRPAGQETRLERGRAHTAFDPLWREGYMERNEAYAWLAGQLRLTRATCHIGYMDAKAAARAFRICSAKLRELRETAQAS